MCTLRGRHQRNLPRFLSVYICWGSACTGFPRSTFQLQQKPPNRSSYTTSHNAMCGQICYVVCLRFWLLTYSPIVVDLVPTQLSLVCLSAIHFLQSTTSSLCPSASITFCLILATTSKKCKSLSWSQKCQNVLCLCHCRTSTKTL